MKLAVIHSLCKEDDCTETWIGYVPDNWTEQTIKTHYLSRGRVVIFSAFTDGFEVSCL